MGVKKRPGLQLTDEADGWVLPINVDGAAPTQEGDAMHKVLTEMGRLTGEFSKVSAEMHAMRTTLDKIEARADRRDEQDKSAALDAARLSMRVEALETQAASSTAARVATDRLVKTLDDRCDKIEQEAAVAAAKSKRWGLAAGSGGTIALAILWGLLKAAGVVPANAPTPVIEPPAQTAPAQPATSSPQKGE